MGLTGTPWIMSKNGEGQRRRIEHGMSEISERARTPRNARRGIRTKNDQKRHRLLVLPRKRHLLLRVAAGHLKLGPS